MNELGNKISRKRKDLGMTQTDFAEKLSVTRQTVSRWEGGTVMPDIDKIGDIASILGFDTVESVAGLVSDVDSIATALDKETGAYEKKEGVSAGQDIIEVVSDLIDK